jgi:hypothetical protein
MGRPIFGVVELDHRDAAKPGAPNDEVFPGHPLHGKAVKPKRPSER